MRTRKGLRGCQARILAHDDGLAHDSPVVSSGLMVNLEGVDGRKPGPPRPPKRWPPNWAFRPAALRDHRWPWSGRGSVV